MASIMDICDVQPIKSANLRFVAKLREERDGFARVQIIADYVVSAQLVAGINTRSLKDRIKNAIDNCVVGVAK